MIQVVIDGSDMLNDIRRMNWDLSSKFLKSIELFAVPEA